MEDGNEKDVKEGGRRKEEEGMGNGEGGRDTQRKKREKRRMQRKTEIRAEKENVKGQGKLGMERESK